MKECLFKSAAPVTTAHRAMIRVSSCCRNVDITLSFPHALKVVSLISCVTDATVSNNYYRKDAKNSNVMPRFAPISMNGLL
jgi:hypothetical protein